MADAAWVKNWHNSSWVWIEHQTTNLGVRSSNLFGRASDINQLKEFWLADPGPLCRLGCTLGYTPTLIRCGCQNVARPYARARARSQGRQDPKRRTRNRLRATASGVRIRPSPPLIKSLTARYLLTFRRGEFHRIFRDFVPRVTKPPLGGDDFYPIMKGRGAMRLISAWEVVRRSPEQMQNSPQASQTANRDAKVLRNVDRRRADDAIAGQAI
jgi:hypothetical protein